MKNGRFAILAALCALALAATACSKDDGREPPEPPRGDLVRKAADRHRAEVWKFPRDRMMRNGYDGRWDLPAMAAIFRPEVLDGLELTEAQKKALRENAVESRRKRAELGKRLELARIDLEQALEAWPVDPEKIRAAGAKLAEARGEFLALRVEMTTFLLSSLDSAQRARLDELRREVMRPKPPKGAPRHGEIPGGPDRLPVPPEPRE